MPSTGGRAKLSFHCGVNLHQGAKFKVPIVDRTSDTSPDHGSSQIKIRRRTVLRATPDHLPTQLTYFAVGIANSAPFSVLSGQRCMIDFCFV